MKVFGTPRIIMEWIYNMRMVQVKEGRKKMPSNSWSIISYAMNIREIKCVDASDKFGIQDDCELPALFYALH